MIIYNYVYNINYILYIYIYPDTAKHQSKPQVYISDIAPCDIKPAVETEYKKTTLTSSKVPTKR